jgi:hypothetical protein
MTWTFLSSHCLVLGSGSLHVFLEPHYCWCSSVDQNCENITLLRSLQCSSFSTAGNLQICATFPPPKAVVYYWKLCLQQFHMFPLSPPQSSPFSLLHCSSLHWMLVWVCVSCGGAILISATLLAKAFICISENLWTLRNNWAQLSWNTDAGKYHRPNGDLCNCKLPLEPWQVKEL